MFYILCFIPNVFSHQMQLRASDQRTPVRIDTTTATIFVERDNNPPFFTSNNYFTQIIEKSAVGTSTIRVNADDNDLVVSTLIIMKIYHWHLYYRNALYYCDKSVIGTSTIKF